MSRSSACALFALSLALLAPATRAQNAAPAIAPDRPLTLEDAIGMAVKKNFALQIQANTVDRTRDTLTINQAQFDPTLSGTLNRNFSKQAATTTQLDASESDNTSLRFGVDQPLIFSNGSLSLQTNLSRAANNNRFSTLNPAFNNNISLALSQPLLRNAGSRAARANILTAKINLGIAFITYKNNVLNLISQTENAYYNLVNARETLRIRQLTLETAQRFFDETQTRQQTGVATPLDVINAEVQVATGKRNVIQAEQGVRNAEEDLLNLINAPDINVRPGPVNFTAYTDGTPNFAVSYKLARESYPDTLTNTETLKTFEIALDTARRNLRPNLNLNASLGYTARPTNEGYTDVISNLPREHGNNWSLGLTYSMPWGRRADKARYHQAQLDLATQKLRIDQAEQQLVVLVRQAVRTVETQVAVVDAAARATEASQRQYEQQKARFDAGLATAFVVLQAQDALENARFTELGAKLQLRRAAAELRRLEGSSLERYRIELPNQ